MPPRPSIRSKPNTRPLSAIYIGNQSNGDNSTNNSSHTSSGPIIATLTNPNVLPDLPEPPSPVSSTGSGLPSPPATNSTGSGSTGDPASIALRRPPPPIMSHTHGERSRSSSRLSFQADDDELHNGEVDEDQTMRIKVGPSPESALQRARNLVQRNKIQLDKMASGRLSSASNSSSSRLNHRHSMPDATQALSGSETEREGDNPIVHSTTSTTSSGTKSSTHSNRIGLHSAPNSPRRVRHNGSNTDSPTRRRKRMSMASMSSQGTSDDENDNHEQRPGKDGQRYEVGTARDRIQDRQNSTLRDSPRTPPVNLNSTRKSPTTSTRRRSALPREFREGSADEQYPNPSNADPPPHTPYRQIPSSSSTSTTTSAPMSTLGRRSTLRTQRMSEDFRNSPSYSTRDLPSTSSLRSGVHTPSNTNNNNTATPPHSASSTKSTHTFDDSPTLMRSNTIGRQHTLGNGSGRRQQLRGGSAESALGSGRSLVGEGLRAAGLGIRKEREKTIIETEVVTRNEGGKGDVFSKDAQRRVDWSPESTESLARQQRRLLVTEPQRASTSMADYSYTSRSRHPEMSEDEDDNEEERDGRVLRTRRSAFPVLASREASLSRKEQTLAEKERELARRERELEREKTGSVLGRHATSSPYSSSTTRDRYSSPFGSTRRNYVASSTTSSSGQGQNSGPSSSQSEHARLMVDSLTMFESQINKLSPLLNQNNHTGQPGNRTEMLMRNAQTLVLSAERLNTMMRSGNSRALDAQIEAEVDGDLTPHQGHLGGSSQQSLVDVWRKIGGEYREGVRVSDELVRALTGFLLGVGRVMKEYSQSGGGSATGSETGSVGTWSNHGGSPNVHARSISLNDDDMRLRGSMSPESCQTGSGGGDRDRSDRGSVMRESRRSWEPSEGKSSTSNPSASTGSREEALRRLAGVRSDSPLARASPAFQAVRELDRLETASPAFGIVAGASTSTSGLGLPRVNIPGVRRLFAPSQQREMALVQQAAASSSASGVLGEGMDTDPSPTPVSRTRVFDRAELGVPGTSHLQHRSPLQQQISLQDGGQVGGEGDGEENDKLSPISQSKSKVYETPLRRAVTISGGPGAASSTTRNRHERGKISITSIATIRAAATNTVTSTSNSTSTTSSAISSGPPGFPSLTTPSGATTAVTLDGVGAIGMVRIRSEGSGTGSTSTGTGTGHSGTSGTGSGSAYSSNVKPTFSRPEGMSSVSGLQQQLEGYRRRTESESLFIVTDGSGGGGGGQGNGNERNQNQNQNRGKGRSTTTTSSLITPESERENRRKTIGSRAGVRMSFDSQRQVGGDGGDGKNAVVDLTVNAADRSAAATISAGGPASMMRKERRRVVTDIWKG